MFVRRHINSIRTYSVCRNVSPENEPCAKLDICAGAKFLSSFMHIII